MQSAIGALLVERLVGDPADAALPLFVACRRGYTRLHVDGGSGSRSAAAQEDGGPHCCVQWAALVDERPATRPPHPTINSL